MKFKCTCGARLAFICSPHPDEFVIISDVELDNCYNLGSVEQLGKRGFKCRECERLWLPGEGQKMIGYTKEVSEDLPASGLPGGIAAR